MTLTPETIAAIRTNAQALKVLWELECRRGWAAFAHHYALGRGSKSTVVEISCPYGRHMITEYARTLPAATRRAVTKLMELQENESWNHKKSKN